MATRIPSGDTYQFLGALDVSGGTLTLKDGQLPRVKLTQREEEMLQIPLTSLRVWDNVTNHLPQTSATDDLGLIEGTWGTDAITVQTYDVKAAGAQTLYAFFEVPLDGLYDEGETIKIRVRGGMVTTVADTTATVDLEVYLNDGDGAVGSDLCTTSATTINSLTKANVAFTITGTSLLHGDSLLCRLAVAINDAATATAVIGEISKITLLRDVK